LVFDTGNRRWGIRFRFVSVEQRRTEVAITRHEFSEMAKNDYLGAYRCSGCGSFSFRPLSGEKGKFIVAFSTAK
jgi:hypothetical protein